jgi:cytochrome c-type biogenesis protein CcmH
LARTPRQDKNIERDIAFYEERLSEIDREVGRALIAPEDAKAVKAEAARRLLTAADRTMAQLVSSSRGRVRLAAVLVLIVVPVVALAVYGDVGHPNWPDQPLEARLESDPGRMDLQMAIAKVEAHLAENPLDGRGYEVLVPAYLRLGRKEDAAHAAENALRLLGETPDRLALYGEMLVLNADGVVTKDAKEAFTKALDGGAFVPKASLYLGLAAEQDGDPTRALAIWNKLLADAPSNAPWADSLRKKIAQLSGGSPQTAMPQTSMPLAPQSTPQGAAIAAMPEAERNATIHSMVDRLAARLAQNGQDVEGWLRLVRAYKVLNEGDKARTALSDARRSLGGDPAAMSRIDALAHELGIEG